ncbi:hypothetical protein AAFG13_37180 [Bradyrhizobium sp. B124]|uniref:hypothetical protein n=1 Tax=Bradyrhizobium sp. B124 TaxID=3140245 RepID=UPI003182FDE3
MLLGGWGTGKFHLATANNAARSLRRPTATLLLYRGHAPQPDSSRHSWHPASDYAFAPCRERSRDRDDQEERSYNHPQSSCPKAAKRHS